MLKEMKIDIDASSLPKNEPGLFKELLELLGSENPDPEALESLIRRVKADSVSEEEGLSLAFREAAGFRPVEVRIGPESKTSHDQKEDASTLSLPVPDIQKSRELSVKPLQTGVPSESKASEGPKRHDRIFLANYLSHAVLKREAGDAKAVHELRSSHTLRELVTRADALGLEVVDLKVVTQKETRPALLPETQKPPLPSPAILQHTERISQSAAEVIWRSKEGSPARAQRPDKAAVTLQNLLTEPKISDKKGEKSVHAKAPKKPGSDFSALLSNLQREPASSSSGTRHADKTAPLQGVSMQDEAAEPGVKPEYGTGESEGAEWSHSEVRSKASEQLTQKIADAKTTLRHFAQTLQERVENYKPPFTRMQISLDPKDLGSVEVTMVSRGNNLHIQVHSNPTAIGIMATHGNELKNQLVSMGFTDVQMQFSMNQQQQQNRQQRHDFGDGYAESEEIPDFYESLDLIIPHYV